MRPATPDDASATSEVLEPAGRAAWGPFLGEERVAAGNRGKVHPADFVAVDDEGVFAFVASDAATGEILRLYTCVRPDLGARPGDLDFGRDVDCQTAALLFASTCA